MGKAPKSIKIDGVRATMEFATASNGSRASACWPMKPCFASGVHADDAQKLRDHFKEGGIECEVSSSGDPIYTSRAHREKCLKYRGFHDKASYS